MKYEIRRALGSLPYMRRLRTLLRRRGHPLSLSLIPPEDEVLAYLASTTSSMGLPDVDMHADRQLELLTRYAELYKDIDFPLAKEPGHRYYYENEWFGYSDAIFLNCLLRDSQPKRIIEIGSGFSSAAMLDTIDRFFVRRPEITLIDPHPERLLGLLRTEDMSQVSVIPHKVQNTSRDVFKAVQSGDLIIIDSSHIFRWGSDLHFLMFQIIPFLPQGVIVHFHDVFYPFEYPAEWASRGYNEDYFLRAWLSSNAEWSVYFFNTYVHFAFPDMVRDRMPLSLQNQGGSLYVVRENRPSCDSGRKGAE